jgi:hypothetical protein
MQGARSVICIYPDDQLIISIMINAEWSSTIEETAHMMARPFLVTDSPQSIPEGRFSISTTTINVRGEETITPGTLEIAEGFGKITFDKNQQVTLKYLNTKNVYALIRPDGIYYLNIDFDGQALTGKAIGYGSQLSESPATNPPFFKFESIK